MAFSEFYVVQPLWLVRVRLQMYRYMSLWFVSIGDACRRVCATGAFLGTRVPAQRLAHGEDCGDAVVAVSSGCVGTALLGNVCSRGRCGVVR